MSSDIQIVKFSVEDMLAIDPTLSDVARLNQQTGPAYTAIQDGKILGCGGIRTDGVGEAWMINSQKVKDEMKFSLLKETRKWLEVMIRNQVLYRVWSESPIPCNQNFIEHLGFRKLSAYLRG